MSNNTRFRLALLCGALLLFTSPSLAQEVGLQVHPLDARNDLLDMVHDAEDSELLALWRSFAEIENDPGMRAFIAAALGIGEAGLLPAPAADIHPVDARAELLAMIDEAEDSDVVELWSYFAELEAELSGLANIVSFQTDDKNRDGGRGNCLDHLPETITIPRGPTFPSLTLPTAGVIKAWCHQAPVRCFVGKKVIRRQIRKETGQKCKFD